MKKMVQIVRPRRWFPIIVPAVLVLIFSYIALQFINGERGIFTWRMVRTQVADLKTENAALAAEVADLEARAKRLRPPADKDYLDELARNALPVGEPGEQIILISPSAYGGSVTTAQ
jgi:cell division protein FtsB